jgi:hypothetical protein
VDRGETVIYLCRTIHLNPVAAGLAAQPSSWPHSNTLERIEARPAAQVDRVFVRGYFSAPADTIAFVENAIRPQKERELTPYLLA